VDVTQTVINALVVAGVGAALGWTVHGLRGEVTGLRAELTALRTEFKADIAELRTELKADIRDVRREIADVRSDLTQVALAVGAKRRASSE
jgi:ribosomal protein L29